MSKNDLNLSFTIKLSSGAIPIPSELHFNINPKEQLPKPFKYMADTLSALSLLKLAPNLQKKLNTPSTLVSQAWENLEPHWEIWSRSRARVLSVAEHSPKKDRRSGSEFETIFDEVISETFQNEKVDLRTLWKLIEPINRLEARKDAPLIYQFGLQFSEAFNEKLTALHSFLFHLRALVAVDWNAQTADPAHEGLMINSITDYIPKAEYIVNDALLYWQFNKLCGPFKEGKNADVRIDKLLIEPMIHAFKKASHNACHLIDSLPKSFFEEMNPHELEEALYIVQMDWLMASEAGLLYRIREELYGLHHGYEKVFWPEHSGSPAQKAVQLSVGFHLKEAFWKKQKAA